MQHFYNGTLTFILNPRIFKIMYLEHKVDFPLFDFRLFTFLLFIFLLLFFSFYQQIHFDRENE